MLLFIRFFLLRSGSFEYKILKDGTVEITEYLGFGGTGAVSDELVKLIAKASV